ncbi:golgin subfamily A member 6-like protein 25 [Trichomycterus rosablanca]|uniref:golgin subfamily A member 6-like protein 25 n=1 Tax=Trichomycterus rosablanca TaxID=2290929 RepID=UPI002F354E37
MKKLDDSRIKEKELKKNLDDSRIKEKELKKNLDDSRVKEKELKKNLDDSRVKEKELKKNLDDSRIKEKELKKNLDDSRIKEKEVKKNLDDSRVKEKELKKNLDDSRIKEKELKKNLDDSRIKEKELKKNLDDSRVKEKELKKNLDDSRIKEKELKKNLDDSRIKEKELKKNLDDSRVKEKELKKNLDDSRIKEKELKKNLDDSRIKEKELKKNLDDSRVKEKELKKELDDSKVKEKELKKELDDSRVKESELKKELDDSRVKESELNRELYDSKVKESELKTELYDSRVKEKELKKELDDSKVKEKELKKNLDDSRVKESELKKELDDSRVKESELKKELDDSRVKESELNRELYDSKVKESELKTELYDSRVKESKLKKELDASRVNKALFTVKSEQNSYDAELHGTVRMACRFSPVQSASQISVIWRRIEPSPPVNVHQLQSGREKLDSVDERFRHRARLLTDELNNLRAVLELSQVRINDSGTYQCIVRETETETDYKQTTLTVRAPYAPVRKSLRRISQNEVELSCASRGFPLARVLWSAGRLAELRSTIRSNSSNETNGDGTFSVTSRLNVTDEPENYTCSFITEDGRVNVSATFSIPGEIPKDGSLLGSTCLAIIAIFLTGVAVCFLTLLIRRRKKKSLCQKGADVTQNDCLSPDQNLTLTWTDLLLPKTDSKADTFVISSEVYDGRVENLREVLKRNYAQLSTAADMMTLPDSVLSGDDQLCETQAVLPGLRETVLLEGEEGPIRSSISQTLAFVWAGSFSSDAFRSVCDLRLLISVDLNKAEGDFYQAVKSRLPTESGLETNDLKEILLGDEDCLLILDSYKEGDGELDESLGEFLTERKTCRVLITSRPGENRTLVEVVRKVLSLHTEPLPS